MGEPTVTINDSPSAQVIAKTQTEFSVTDARGRVIKLKKPAVLAQYRLVEALGDSASNGTYMAMVLPLIYVVAIDEDAVYPAMKKSEVEALIQRLDEDGIQTVMEGVQECFGKVDPEADKKDLKKEFNQVSCANVYGSLKMVSLLIPRFKLTM